MDIYPKGLSVERHTRCVSYNSYNESHPKLGSFRLPYIVRGDMRPAVRFAHCYGMRHEGFTLHNCQGPHDPTTNLQIPDWAALEIVDCINFGCDPIYLQNNNGIGVRLIGMGGIDPETPKHWSGQLNLNIISQGNNYDIFKYLQESDITYYTESGVFTTGKTLIRQCHDVEFNINGLGMCDVDNYSLGLCRFENGPYHPGEILTRKVKPIVEPDPSTGNKWANIASSGQNTQLVCTSYYPNCKAYIFPELSSRIAKAGDGIEITAVVDIELPAPSTGDDIVWFKITSGQEHNGQMNMGVPIGKLRNRVFVRLIGGWEVDTIAPAMNLWFGAGPSIPIGTKIDINDLKVTYFG